VPLIGTKWQQDKATLKFLKALKTVLEVGFTNPGNLRTAAENFTLTLSEVQEM